MKAIILINRSIGKTPIHSDHSAVSKGFKLSHKASKFKFDGRVRITNYMNIFRKGYTEKWSK